MQIFCVFLKETGAHLAGIGGLVSIPNWIICLLFACLFASSCHNTHRTAVASQQEPDTLASPVMADSLLEPMECKEETEAPSVFIGDVEGGQYLEIRDSSVSSSGLMGYFLFDITGDKVPELWLLTDDCEASRELLVYSVSDRDNALYRCYAGHSSYYQGKGYVLKIVAHMGHAEWYKLRWNGTRIVSRKVFSEYTPTDYREPSESPLHYLSSRDSSSKELLRWIKDYN